MNLIACACEQTSTCFCGLIGFVAGVVIAAVVYLKLSTRRSQ